MVSHLSVVLGLKLASAAVLPAGPARAADGDARIVPELLVVPHSMNVRAQGSEDPLGAGRQVEVGSELAFLTSRGPMAGFPGLSFTDVALWRTRFAISPRPRFKLVGGVSLLAKQPATTEESFWQSASLGARVGATAGTAIAVDASLGRLIGGAGYHGMAALGLQGRRLMNRFVIFDGRVGGTATNFWYDPSPIDRFWFVETTASGQMQLCWDWCHRRNGATWVGIDLAVPVYRRPGAPDPATALELDPRTRVGLTLGSFFTVTRHWDFFATVAWIDRGDPAVPATQLPVIDGGFDQVQIVLGLIAHWRLDPCVPGDPDPNCRWRHYEYNTGFNDSQ